MWYKIVESDWREHTNIQFKTLFHGNCGSRIIPTDTWLQADEKMVHDGTAGTEYLSGWHVIPTREEAQHYRDKFTAKRPGSLDIVRVWTHNVRPKKHSRAPIYLAEWIYLGAWPNAQ